MKDAMEEALCPNGLAPPILGPVKTGAGVGLGRFAGPVSPILLPLSFCVLKGISNEAYVGAMATSVSLGGFEVL